MSTSSRTLRVPIARVFVPLLDPKRYKGAYGGRGSGKSHFFAERMVTRALSQPGFRGVCIREVQKSLKESAKRLIEDKIRAHGLVGKFRILEDEIRTPGDGVIIFQGMQNHTSDSIKSLEGYDVAWVEEAHSLTAKSLTLLRPTIRKPGSELWFSWNPTRKSDAVDEFFRKRTPPNAVVVEANWRDNPWFPDELRTDMAQDRINDPDEAAHIWDGEYQSVAKGAYYAEQLKEVRKSGRIGKVPIDPALPVHTAWDLGRGGNMSVWLFQITLGGIRVVAYQPGDHTKGIPTSIKRLEERFPGVEWGEDYVPHDAKVLELGSERTRVETYQALGRRPRVVTMHRVDDGINAVKEILRLCWFDEENCEEGLDLLGQYAPNFDDEDEVFSISPARKKATHPADAFRYLAMVYREIRAKPPEEKKPDRLIYEVKPDGSVVANMSVRELVEMKMRRKERA